MGEGITKRALNGIILLGGLLVLLAWLPRLPLVLFSGILVAVFLSSLSDLLRRVLPLSAGFALALVILGLVGLFSGLVLLFGTDIIQGIGELERNFSQSVRQVGAYIDEHEWAQRLIELLPGGITLETIGPETFGRVGGFFSTTLGALLSAIIIAALGIYISAEPRIYINGLIRLFPPIRRSRIREVLGEIGYVVRWWLVGASVAMLLVGGITTVGLLLLGVPQAFSLGILAALFEFIPNLGPILAAIPAVLIAFSAEPMLGFYVGLLYLSIQFLEGYLITPLVQRKVILLAPALLIAVQILMGIAFGILGLILAAPIAVVSLVLVEMLYINDILGDSVEPP